MSENDDKCIIRSSALSYLGNPQIPRVDQIQEEKNTNNNSPGGPSTGMPMPPPPPETLVPPGVKALLDACTALYPDQPNPLQVTTRLKYWLGGQDPLDYISMYWNPGDKDLKVPPHWHYISFGLTDLHGDGRVHPVNMGISGAGSELTFRLVAEHGTPPLWPAALLQALARYIMTTGNKLCAGDHVSWHSALDGTLSSRVKHLLVADDPKLRSIATPHGSVGFLQLIGCTGRELRAAQRISGFHVLQLLANDHKSSGPYLVTNPRRRRSVRLSSPTGGDAMAPLAGVSAPVQWTVWGDEPPMVTKSIQEQIKRTLRQGLRSMGERESEGHMSTDSFTMASIEKALPTVDEMQSSWRSNASDTERVQYLPGVHLTFTPEGASLLPLAINGRIKPGAHFTWRGCDNVTMLSPRVTHSLVSQDRPKALADNWLQILIPNDLAEDMSKKLSHLTKLTDTDSETESETEESERDSDSPPSCLPVTFEWPKHGLKITVVNSLVL